MLPRIHRQAGSLLSLPHLSPSDPYGGKKQNVERDYSEFALLASGTLSEEPKCAVSTERER